MAEKNTNPITLLLRLFQNAPPMSNELQNVKTVREFEEVLNSTLSQFSSVVITEIAQFAEFVKKICWRCEENIWEEYAEELGGFTILRSGYYPPEVYDCNKCRELRFAWGCLASPFKLPF